MIPRLRRDPLAIAAALSLALGAAAAGPALGIAVARVTAERPSPPPPAFARPGGWTVELAAAEALRADALDVLTRAFLAMAAVVLAAAAVNLATLLLARAGARRHETAVRAALGATPWALGRRALGEAAAIAAVGGTAGLLLGGLAGQAALRAWPGADPLAIGARPLAWTAAAAGALASLVLCSGVLSAAGAGRRGLYGALSAGRRATAGPVEILARRALVVLQFAGSATLLTGAVLLLRASSSRAAAIPSGLDPRDTLVLRVWLPAHDGAAAPELQRRLLAAAQGVPGVSGAGISHPDAWLGLGPEDAVRTLCDACMWGNTYAPIIPGTARYMAVSPGWFAGVGVPVREGREMAPDDQRAVVINRAFAVQLLPRAQPVGQRVVFQGWWDDPYDVVGVVDEVRAPGPGTAGLVPPTIYLSSLRHPPSPLGIAARADDAEAVRGALRAALAAAVPGARISPAETLAEAMRRHAAPLRWFAFALAALAAAATLAAAGGLYGLMAFAVARRTREVGVRMALGAAPRTVVREVLAEGGRLALAGMVAGGVGALTLARMLQERYHGVDPLDGSTYLAVAAILALVTLGGTAGPAVRASRVEPAEALRAE